MAPFAVLTVSAIPRPIEAEENPAVAAPLPKATVPLSIDGLLDEPVWKKAPAVRVDYVMGQTGQLADAPRMAARFAWDDDYLYIGYEAFDANLTPRGSGEVEGPEGNRRDGASIWHSTEKVDVAEFFISLGDTQFFWEIHHNAFNQFNDVWCTVFDENRPIGRSALARFGIHFGHGETLADDVDAGKRVARAVKLMPKADGRPSTPNVPTDTDAGYTGEIRIPWGSLGAAVDRETWITTEDPKTGEKKRYHGPWRMAGQELMILAVSQDADLADRYHHSSPTFPGGWFHKGAAQWPRYVLRD